MRYGGNCLWMIPALTNTDNIKMRHSMRAGSQSEEVPVEMRKYAVC